MSFIIRAFADAKVKYGLPKEARLGINVWITRKTIDMSKPRITVIQWCGAVFLVLELRFYAFKNSIITFVGLQSFFVNALTVAQIPPPITARTPNAVTPVSPAFFLQAEHIPVLFFPTMVLPHNLHFLSLCKTEIMNCMKLIVIVFNIHPFSVFGMILHITPFERIGMAGTEF